MPYPAEKVTMMEVTTGGTPYKNIKPEDLKRSDTSSTTSIQVTTISGRKVFIPKPK